MSRTATFLFRTYMTTHHTYGYPSYNWFTPMLNMFPSKDKRPGQNGDQHATGKARERHNSLARHWNNKYYNNAHITTNAHTTYIKHQEWPVMGLKDMN